MKAQAGKIRLIEVRPPCDFQGQGGCPTPAEYEFKSWLGPWVFGCERHYYAHRAYDDLGFGKAQLLITRED